MRIENEGVEGDAGVEEDAGVDSSVSGNDGGVKPAAGEIEALGAQTPLITSQPVDVDTYTVSSVKLTVVAANPSGVDSTANPLTYQWYAVDANTNYGGTSVGADSGGQTATFTPPIGTAGTFYYYCVVSNGITYVSSRAARVTRVIAVQTGAIEPGGKIWPDAAYGYTAQEYRFTATNTGNEYFDTPRIMFGKGLNSPFEFSYAEQGRGFTLNNNGSEWRYVIGYLGDANIIDPGESFVFGVRPIEGLAPGTYTDTLTFNHDDSHPQPPTNHLLASYTLSFTVTEVDGTAGIVWPTASALAYGQTLSESTLSGGSIPGGGTFEWQDAQTIPSVSNNGYVVVAKPAGGTGYSFAGDLTHRTAITVAPRQLTGTWSADDKVYDGTATATAHFTANNLVGTDADPVWSVTAAFADATVGAAKPVSITAIALKDSYNSNYLAPAVSAETPVIVTASITKTAPTTLPKQTYYVPAGKESNIMFSQDTPPWDGAASGLDTSGLYADYVNVQDPSGLLAGGILIHHRNVFFDFKNTPYSDSLQPVTFDIVIRMSNIG
ncbi:MAG: YDG domain-containing protein, partial [Clostridiales Family XIII bacterium]|nr:YDG domain-containing protein [Clostridiales Family XIII bacterium]